MSTPKTCFSFLLVVTLAFVSLFVFRFSGNYEADQTEKREFQDDNPNSITFSRSDEGDEEKYSEFEATQRKRKAWVIEACKHITKPKGLTKSLLGHLLVSDRHQVLLCYIPKVACTTWKGLFIKLSGKLDNSTKLTPAFIHRNNKILKTLSRYNAESIRKRLHTYKSFVFVRDPFERLLSAYLNKFAEVTTNVDFHRRYGRQIIKTYRANASLSSLRTGENVTFPEFVKFVLAEGKRKGYINEHWDQFNSLCSPCYMNYDFIGKFETIHTDADIILKELGVRDVVEFPSRSSRTGPLMETYYSQIDKTDLKQLWKQYEKDYFLWNYPKPSFLDLS